eukprot:tig00021518_g22039.t1
MTTFPGHDPDEIWGFHGTPQANVASIVQNGFSASHQTNNAYGRGTYFARDPNVAVSYAAKFGASVGPKHIFLCNVLIGAEGKDSIYVSSQRYYVIPNTAGCVPRFLITLP